MPQRRIERFLEVLLSQDRTNIEQRSGRICRRNRADSHDIADGHARDMVDADPLVGDSMCCRNDLEDLPRVALDPEEPKCAPVRGRSLHPQASREQVLRPRLRGSADAIDARERWNQEPRPLAPVECVPGQSESKRLVACYQPVLSGGKFQTGLVDRALHGTQASRFGRSEMWRAPHSVTSSAK